MTTKASWISRHQTELFLFLVLLFFRLPFFFRDYMDHDESTFILMGQSVADGYLPYDRLWDLKPPLLFYLFGLIEWIFPHSLLAVRLFGLAVIFISCLLLLRIARIAGLKNPLLIAFSYAVLSSLFGSVQGVMSEHVSVLFLLAGVFFFIRGNALPAGIFLGCAVMCKMNYAYVIPALIVYLVIRKELYRPVLRKVLLISAGVFTTFFFVALPFIVKGRLDLFTSSVFLAPFEYGRASSLDIAFKLKKTWWIILAALVVAGMSLRKAGPLHREIAAISALVLLMTVYTFYSSGTVNGHYLIQVYPFMAILLLGVMAGSIRIRTIYLVVLSLAISAESWMEYARVVRQLADKNTPYNGKSFIVVDSLKNWGLEKKTIFFADYHIGYWFLRQYPLTKSTTHPSSLKRPYLFRYMDNPRRTSLEELKYLFEELKPEIVVSKNPHLSFFVEGTPENRYFVDKMDSEYKRIVADEKNRIYIWLQFE